MILFLFTIVFIAQLIITAAIISKLLDFDIAIITLDERLQTAKPITECSMYYLKEVTESYKDLVSITFQNFDKKLNKSKTARLKSAIISLIIALLPKNIRKIINSTTWGFKIARYLYKL